MAKLLILTGETEMQIEIQRQQLCKAQSFEPYASFQRIDRGGKGYISTKDLREYVRQNGVEGVQMMECQHVIKFFDSTMEGRLHYTDFLQIVLPCDNQYLRAQATQRQTYEVNHDQFLPEGIEKLLSKLILKELKLAKEEEQLKQQLACRYDYSLDLLFKSIDDWNYKYIDQINLKRFLIKCSVLPHDNLLLAIIRRMDLDADAKLNLKEFIDSVRPNENFTNKKAHKPLQLTKTKKASRPKSSLARPSNYSKDLDQYRPASSFATPNQRQPNRSILKKSATRTSGFIDNSSSQRKLGIRDLQQRQEQVYEETGPQLHSQQMGDNAVSMISIVRDVFQEILDLENRIEVVRKELGMRRDFTLGAAYNLFAKNTQHQITQDDFMFGLDRLDLRVSPEDAALFFARYDSNESGRLGFWEFSNAVLPLEIRLRDEIEQRTQPYDLSYETRDIMVRAIRQTINLEVEMERIRHTIQRNVLISLRQGFENIDWLNRGYLTKGDIKRLIDTYPQHVSSATVQRSHPDGIEMEALVRRFNKDKQNGKISLPEWVEELTQKLR